MNFHQALHHLGAFLVGIVIGFLGGLFGKGGSAIATPMLSLVGFPGFVAVAAPLPATIPGTLIASAQYWRSRLLDWPVIWWSVAIGTPATIVGSYLTFYTGSQPLLILTGIMVLGFGLAFLLMPAEAKRAQLASEGLAETRPAYWQLRLVLVATGVGLISGLLANSGGFLLAPSYARFLKQPIKKAFACSLAVSAVLAVPGTVVHARLGHISWAVTGLLALGSVPFSYLGAGVAIRTRATRLERWYGVALTILGIFFLFHLA
ncbi:MAG: sulfite exporter TauE/SafE family protein [Chlamydiota bacterium]